MSRYIDHDFRWISIFVRNIHRSREPKNVGCKTAIKDYKPLTDRGGAARGAEQRKVKDYEKCLDPNSQSLMLLTFEIQGRWSPISLRFFELIKRVGLQKRDLQGQSHSLLSCKSVTYREKCIAFGLASGDGPYRLDFSGTVQARSVLNIKDQLFDKHSGAKRSYSRRFLGRA